MYGWICGLLVVILVLWIYFMQFHRIATDFAIFNDDFIKHPSLKTGDLILFKAYNNFNSIFTGSYFGHVGLVYIDPTGIPMMFESNGIEQTPLKSHHSKTGLFLTPLADRIKKYKGRCFWKPLNKPVSQHNIDDFTVFMKHALNTFQYDYAVIISALVRGFGLRKYTTDTDCGQTAFLSLIKLGLLHVDEFDKNIFHNLKYVCKLTDLNGSPGYKYLDLVEIIDHPFAY